MNRFRLLAVLASVVVVTLGGCGGEATTTVVVPDVVGMNHDKAEAVVVAAGLAWRWIPSEVGNSEVGVAEWVVTGQKPAAGQVVEPASTVILTARPAGAAPSRTTPASPLEPAPEP